MRLALDIDNTITAVPEFFSEITSSNFFDRIIIVTARSDHGDSRSYTEAQLAAWSIRYDALFFLDDSELAESSSKDQPLDWYQQFLIQKVNICRKERIDVIFDDDRVVVQLFREHAPEIQVFQSFPAEHQHELSETEQSRHRRNAVLHA